jgi:hypothetical protein
MLEMLPLHSVPLMLMLLRVWQLLGPQPTQTAPMLSAHSLLLGMQPTQTAPMLSARTLLLGLPHLILACFLCRQLIAPTHLPPH